MEWFYDKAAAHREAITRADVDATLLTFAGTAGVLGAMGVYRAAFTAIEQTEPLAGLLGRKAQVPVVALVGAKGLGEKVLAMVKMVAKDVVREVIADCGHFVPEERPEEVVRHVQALTARAAGIERRALTGHTASAGRETCQR